MQAREQLGERVQQMRPQIGDRRAGEERAVRERVLEVPRDQHRVEIARPAGDDPDRLDDRQALAFEPAQQRPLAAGGPLRQLLQRVEGAVVLDEPHDVAADAADQVDDARSDVHSSSGVVPRQVEEARMARARDELELRRRISRA